MKVNRKAKMFAVLLCVAMVFACTVTAFSATEKKGSITASFKLKDTEFELFKIGSIGNDGIVLTETFSKYNVDMDSEYFADTLTLYVKRDKIAPYRKSLTNASGEVKFDNLDKAVYLLVGNNVEVNGNYYNIKPSVISLPYNDGNSLVWDVNVEVKYEVTIDNGGICDINTMKIWRNRIKGKPLQDIEIQLLRDWEVYDTIILNEANNWTYEWEDLDRKYHWSIIEKDVPPDYKVNIRTEGDLHTVTNTNVVNIEPKPTVPTTPTEQSTVPTETQPTTEPDDKLTQTGQLNWPVPVLICCGAVFIILGIALMRKKQ